MRLPLAIAALLATMGLPAAAGAATTVSYDAATGLRVQGDTPARV